MPVPYFVNFFNNALQIVDLTLTEAVTKSINQYLLDTSVVENDEVDPLTFLGSKRIQEIVLDSCIFNDNSMVNLLEDMHDHKYVDRLTISNCKLGPKSFEKLINIIGTISEVRFTNLQGIT